MRLRGHLKKLVYGTRPFYRGSFPYFGTKVHFPLGSLLFDRVCEEGIYELDTVKLIQSLIRPTTTYMDVGANIGLTAVPVLASHRDVTVISVEASPTTVGLLRRTCETSQFKDRWHIVGAAVGNSVGEMTFWVSDPPRSALDGLRDTGRGGKKVAHTVSGKRLDDIWHDFDRPTVSVVKIDVEGGEAFVLEGAAELIAAERPAIVIEWNRENLKAYDIKPDHLFRICDEINYRTLAHPTLSEINSGAVLAAAMAQTEIFLLVPVDADHQAAGAT